MGIIVGIETTGYLNKYLIDDGTGLIPCTEWITKDQTRKMGLGFPIPSLPFGSLVRILGRVKDFRQSRQVTISSLRESS